jgi:lariat debranching enzyme
MRRRGPLSLALLTVARLLGQIAVEGCCHGELPKIYDTIVQAEQQTGQKIDLLICCGDFEALRDHGDLLSMACPPKYRHMGAFYQYYTGERVAPVPTLFIAGNHEGAHYLWELPHGGWVAPNIYYLGFAGVVRFGGLRIAGLSGIFDDRDFLRGHWETPPMDERAVRSFYHVRALDAFRLMHVSGPVDIGLSHDWPRGIYHHGDCPGLLRKKPCVAVVAGPGPAGRLR